MTTTPKKLRPIKMPPPPLKTILGGEDAYKTATDKYKLAWLRQYLEQLSQVAELAGISTSELLDNKPLMTFAEKTYGLGRSEPEKKSGRPKGWSEQALFHLWWFVECKKPEHQGKVSEALRAYKRQFVSDNTPETLNTVYYNEALKKSELVKHCIKVLEDPEHLLKEGFSREQRLQLIQDLANSISEPPPKKPVGKA